MHSAGEREVVTSSKQHVNVEGLSILQSNAGDNSGLGASSDALNDNYTWTKLGKILYKPKGVSLVGDEERVQNEESPG